MLYATIGIFEEGTDKELSYNEPGEICITCPMVMQGYLNNESDKQCLDDFFRSFGFLDLYVTPYYRMTMTNVFHALMKNALKNGIIRPEDLAE